MRMVATTEGAMMGARTVHVKKSGSSTLSPTSTPPTTPTPFDVKQDSTSSSASSSASKAHSFLAQRRRQPRRRTTKPFLTTSNTATTTPKTTTTVRPTKNIKPLREQSPNRGRGTAEPATPAKQQPSLESMTFRHHRASPPPYKPAATRMAHAAAIQAYNNKLRQKKEQANQVHVPSLASVSVTSTLATARNAPTIASKESANNNNNNATKKMSEQEVQFAASLFNNSHMQKLTTPRLKPKPRKKLATLQQSSHVPPPRQPYSKGGTPPPHDDNKLDETGPPSPETTTAMTRIAHESCSAYSFLARRRAARRRREEEAAAVGGDAPIKTTRPVDQDHSPEHEGEYNSRSSTPTKTTTGSTTSHATVSTVATTSPNRITSSCPTTPTTRLAPPSHPTVLSDHNLALRNPTPLKALRSLTPTNATSTAKNNVATTTNTISTTSTESPNTSSPPRFNSISSSKKASLSSIRNATPTRYLRALTPTRLARSGSGGMSNPSSRTPTPTKARSPATTRSSSVPKRRTELLYNYNHSKNNHHVNDGAIVPLSVTPTLSEALQQSRALVTTSPSMGRSTTMAMATALTASKRQSSFRKDKSKNNKKRLIVLLSQGVTNRIQYANQTRALTLLEARATPYYIVDGVNPQQRTRRNELFEISGVRGNYPQFFFEHANGTTTYFGDWERLQLVNDYSSTLSPGRLQSNPHIQTWDQVFGNVVHSIE